MAHLSNETCRRGERCREGELFRHYNTRALNAALEANDPKVLAAYKLRALSWRALIEPGGPGNLRLSLSLGLEDNYTRRAYRNLARAIEEVWPYEITRNPMAPSEGISDLAHRLERHQLRADISAPKCAFNNDGYDVRLSAGRRALAGSISLSELRSEIERYGGHCDVFVWWNNQGLISGRDTPPRQRSIQIFSSDVQVVNKLLKEFS